MPKLVQTVAACEHVTEATVIATCNRVEIYADVDRFHGSVEELSRLLVERAGESTEAMLPHLYVHYDDGAVSHLFQVAAGLDSMVVGEGQILGQTRDALRLGQELGTVGPALNVLFQQALRVGKRARAETDIDRAAPSLVGAALDRAARHGGDVAGTPGRRRRRRRDGRAGHRHRLAARRRRASSSPTAPASSAERLAAEYGGRAGAARPSCPPTLAEADVVISCTGATGAAGHARPWSRPPAPTAGRWSSSTSPCRTTSTRRSPSCRASPASTWPTSPRSSTTPTPAARSPRSAGSSTEEVAAFLAARRSASVTPTVVALRSMATAVVDAEMERLDHRLPDLDPEARAEVLHAVRRVADKLLHEPTVRVRELANETGAVSYAAALAELFALDPEAVDAVTRPEGLRMTDRSGSAPAPRCSPPPSPSWSPAMIRERLGREVELVEVTTEGDRTQAAGTPLEQAGGTGVFVSALRDALLRGEVDVAVHSLKDLPTAAADGIALAAVPAREDPRDVVVARDGLTLGELPAGCRVGTGSPRRVAQLHALGLGLDVVGVRGNVDTRIGKVRSGEYDAVRPRPRRAGPDRPARRGHRGARPAADAARPRAGCAGGRVPRRRRPR